jgi:Flp pilus assembly pilin Flp
MVQLLWLVRNRVLGFLRDERGQDVFEYVLVIGAVSVAVLTAIITPVGSTLINAVVDGTCSAIDGLPGIAVTCT